MIWRRYIGKEAVKVFALFLIGCYCIYALLEYSMHMQDFHTGVSPPFREALLYYAYQFIGKLDLLIPLALMIATIKVLSTLSKHHELFAFQAGGVKMSHLMRPFLLLALLSSVLIGMSHEWLIPTSLNKISSFEATYFKRQRASKKKKSALHVIPLSESSRLAYQEHDQSQKRLFDVFWIPSPGELYRIKWLYVGGKTPVGTLVDHLRKNEEGLLEKVASHDHLAFPDISLEQKYSLIPYENRPISELFASASSAKARTHLFYKLAVTLIPLIIILGCAPPCIQFSRNIPVFFIFGIAAASFVAFFTILKASLVLGENHVVSPFLAIFSIPLVLFFSLGTFYWRNCR